MNRWNFLYFLIIGYCLLFVVTWMFLMNQRAGEYVSLAVYYENVAVELIESNQSEYAAHYCLVAEAFCNLYNGMRGELTVTWGGSDVQKGNRDRFDTICNSIFGYGGSQCSEATGEIMINYIENIEPAGEVELPWTQ